MRPLKILYHHRTRGRGAEGLHIARIVQAWQAMGHEVTVLSPPGVDPLLNLAAPAGAGPRAGGFWRLVSTRMPGLVFELSEIAYNLPAWWRLRRALRATRYDLVYERYAFYLVAGAWLARRQGIPFVLEANEVNGIESRNRRQWMPGLCARFEHWLLAQCRSIHVVSSYLAKMLIERQVPAGRIAVTPNAYDRIEPARPNKDPALQARLGITEGDRVMGFAGYFSHWDRLDLMIEVFARLCARHEHIKLLLIGDGPMSDDLRSQAKALGVADRIIFTGLVPRTEVTRYLALIDLAVLPHSNKFGSPVVMFEFMGLHIPVVAPRLEPILDVHGDETTARLFDPLDRDQLEAAVEDLLTNAGAARVQAARAHARLLAHHTWQRNAEQILTTAGLLSPPDATMAPSHPQESH